MQTYKTMSKYENMIFQSVGCSSFICLLSVIDRSSHSSDPAQSGAGVIGRACRIARRKSSRGAERKRQSIGQGQTLVYAQHIVKMFPLIFFSVHGKV